MENQRRCLQQAPTPSMDSTSLLDLLHTGRMYEISRNGTPPQRFQVIPQELRMSVTALLGAAIETVGETEGEQEVQTTQQ